MYDFDVAYDFVVVHDCDLLVITNLKQNSSDVILKFLNTKDTKIPNSYHNLDSKNTLVILGILFEYQEY